MYIFFKLWFCHLEPCLSKCGHLEVIYLLLWDANSETTRSAESGHLNSANCVLIFEASSGSPWIFTYLVLTFHFPLVVTSFSLCCLTSVSQYPHRVVSRQKPISSSVSRSKLVEMLSKIPLGSHVLQLSGSHAVQNQTGLVLGLVWLSFKKKEIFWRFHTKLTLPKYSQSKHWTVSTDAPVKPHFSIWYEGSQFLGPKC